MGTSIGWLKSGLLDRTHNNVFDTYPNLTSLAPIIPTEQRHPGWLLSLPGTRIHRDCAIIVREEAPVPHSCGLPWGNMRGPRRE